MHAYEASLQVWFHCAGLTDEGAMSCPTTLHRILRLATLDAAMEYGSHTDVAAAKRRRVRSACRDTGKHDFGSLPAAQECSGRQKKTRREEGRQEVIDWR